NTAFALGSPGVSKSGGPARTIHVPSEPGMPITAARAAASSVASSGSSSRSIRSWPWRVCTSIAGGPPASAGDGPGRYCAPRLGADDHRARALGRVAIGVVAVVPRARLHERAKILHEADREARVAEIAARRDRIGVADAAIEVRREHRLGERRPGSDPAQAPV